MEGYQAGASVIVGGDRGRGCNTTSCENTRARLDHRLAPARNREGSLAEGAEEQEPVRGKWEGGGQRLRCFLGLDL